VEHLCITVRLLDPVFHGRSEAGVLEWPPSPLRTFQALVSAAAGTGGGTISSESAAALAWLERLPAPTIVAPEGNAGTSFQMSVPFNAMDVVARAWSRGNTSNIGDANPAKHRHMKDGKAVLIAGDLPVHYLWPLADHGEDIFHAKTIGNLAREVVRLGWGVNLAIGDASIVDDVGVERLPGVTWRPGGHAGGGLQVPRAGTLHDLIRRHHQFLQRMKTGTLVPPDPVEAFDRRGYRRTGDVRTREIAVFGLLDPGGPRQDTGSRLNSPRHRDLVR
jgi:CRISPR-associated protein Csb2